MHETGSVRAETERSRNNKRDRHRVHETGSVRAQTERGRNYKRDCVHETGSVRRTERGREMRLQGS